VFYNKTFEGKHGRLMLELQKSYQGDERFRLNEKFGDIDARKVNKILKKDVNDHLVQESIAFSTFLLDLAI
jgi:hypothetical protein